jgi:hypothetical protein
VIQKKLTQVMHFSSVFSINGQEDFERMLKADTAEGKHMKFDEVDILQRL